MRSFWGTERQHVVRARVDETSKALQRAEYECFESAEEVKLLLVLARNCPDELRPCVMREYKDADDRSEKLKAKASQLRKELVEYQRKLDRTVALNQLTQMHKMT